MKYTLSLFGGVLAFAGGATAHYTFPSLIVNGAVTGEWQYVRAHTNSNSPVESVASTNIRCNVGGLQSGPSTGVATVQAGSTVGFTTDGGGITHQEPLTVHISRATNGDVKTYDGSGPWFKIAEIGAVITTRAMQWPAEGLKEYSFKIPATTPPGQYLLRIEHIGLHNAATENSAQFYISCAQIDVQGPGGGTPSPTILLPGGYSSTDPSILINIWWPIPASYSPPGPAVWSG